MSNILKSMQLDELSNTKLAQYKTAAAADAKKADSEGDYKRGNKRFSGINKATMKQFDNDSKGVTEQSNNDLFIEKQNIRLMTTTQRREYALARLAATNDDKYAHIASKAGAGHFEIMNAIRGQQGVDEGSSADYRQFFDKEDTAMKKNKNSYSTQAPKFNSKQEYENWVEKNKLAKHDLTRQKDPEEKVGMEETNNKYHANRTGFSRGPRDDERHDLDVQQTSPQVWGLKIKGNVWSKNGKDVTFTSKEAATKSMNSILKMHPDLQGKIGLVTKGGKQGVSEDARVWHPKKLMFISKKIQEAHLY